VTAIDPGENQMARRVPQKQRIKQRHPKIEREKTNDMFMRLGLLLFCGLGLASGFVYAGRQHFTALNYGYKTEELRRERDRLAEDQRRYLMQREAAASPIHLEQAAKRLGLQPLQAAQIDPLRQPKTSEAKVVTVPKTSATSSRDVARSKPAPPVQNARGRSKPI
jgi:uncharacterized protein HemX